MVPMIYTAPPAPGATVATVRGPGHRPSGTEPGFTVSSTWPRIFAEVGVLKGVASC
jgi:hypothetical protein